MQVPKYNEMYNEFLLILKDGKKHDIKEIREEVSKKLKLTESDINATLNSGKNMYFNRIGWTATYLKKAGLIDSKKRGIFQITKEGNKVYKSNITINNKFLLRYESFAKFILNNKKGATNEDPEKIELTPQERIEESIQEINNELEDNLLDEIKKQPFIFLETLAVKLMLRMGYGNKENASVTKPTNDGGIDGVVFEDELGINKILIQTKLYAKDEKVIRPEIQKFKGAMEDYVAKKGVFFTTSTFSPKAIESANKSNIVTIDGKKLVRLMIKYNVGCYIDNAYEIKKLDLDFFENE